VNRLQLTFPLLSLVPVPTHVFVVHGFLLELSYPLLPFGPQTDLGAFFFSTQSRTALELLDPLPYFSGRTRDCLLSSFFPLLTIPPTDRRIRRLFFPVYPLCPAFLGFLKSKLFDVSRPRPLCISRKECRLFFGLVFQPSSFFTTPLSDIKNRLLAKLRLFPDTWSCKHCDPPPFSLITFPLFQTFAGPFSFLIDQNLTFPPPALSWVLVLVYCSASPFFPHNLFVVFFLSLAPYERENPCPRRAVYSVLFF